MLLFGICIWPYKVVAEVKRVGKIAGVSPNSKKVRPPKLCSSLDGGCRHLGAGVHKAKIEVLNCFVCL